MGLFGYSKRTKASSTHGTVVGNRIAEIIQLSTDSRTLVEIANEAGVCSQGLTRLYNAPHEAPHQWIAQALAPVLGVSVHTIYQYEDYSVGGGSDEDNVNTWRTKR